MDVFNDIDELEQEAIKEAKQFDPNCENRYVYAYALGAFKAKIREYIYQNFMPKGGNE